MGDVLTYKYSMVLVRRIFVFVFVQIYLLIKRLEMKRFNY